MFPFGQPHTYENDQLPEVIIRSLHTKPADGRTPVVRGSNAVTTGISKTTVQRWMQNYWRSCRLGKNKIVSRKLEGYKLSTDKFIVEKARNIVRMHLNQASNTFASCIDKETHVQAMDRT